MNAQGSQSSSFRRSPTATILAAGALALACAAPVAAQSLAAGASAYQGPANMTRQGELRMPLTQKTQIVYEPRPWQPATPLPTDYTVARPQASLGLEFKAPSKDNNLRSLLRVQLSSDSFVQFRPRGGGLSVAYKSQF